MTTAPASQKPALEAGFTLIEILVVLFLVASVLGLATTLLVRANQRFRGATNAADAHIEMGFAADLVARDIRTASNATANDDSLTLTAADGSHIVWSLRDGRLTRSSSQGERTWRAGLAGLSVMTERAKSGTPFVEVTLETKPAKDGRSQVFYVGASPRVNEVE